MARQSPVVGRFPKRELLAKIDPQSRRFNKRSLFQAVAGGIVGIVLPDAAVTEIDPILAAIDAHARAYAELDRALGRQEVLERSLLLRFGGFDEAAFDDDSNWIPLQAELDSLHEAETRAALLLLRAEPSALAGEVARKRYVAGLSRAGYQWSSVAAILQSES